MKFLNLCLRQGLCTNRCNKSIVRFASHISWQKPSGKDTGIVVYNCITKEKVPLILNNNTSTWYSCGPTVYDSAHIGHASCYVKLDIIQKILMNYFKINLITSMGVTDIDDKIINKSQVLKRSPEDIAKEYELEFWKDLSDLGVMMPQIVTRVTEHIPTITSFIKGIMDKGIGYIGADRSVYFDTHGYQNYGKLQPSQHYDEEADTTAKKSKADFALWKAHKPGEPFWEAEWGDGRPGWHIECSAMASRLFGSNIDFHAGGIDLQFPHHENEEAQSCAFHNNQQWVNYWLHPGHLHIKGDVKMSKSLKNTISVCQLLESHDAATFRMACLLSNYRNHMEYHPEIMNNAKSVVSKIKYFIEECSKYMNNNTCIVAVDENILIPEFENTKQIVDRSLKDDFDTARAIGQIVHLAHVTNKMITNTENTHADFKPFVVGPISTFVQDIVSNCFGVNLDKHKIQKPNTLPNIVDLLITFRHNVRANSLESKNKDLLTECDQVRDVLKKYKIKVNDAKGQESSWMYTE